MYPIQNRLDMPLLALLACLLLPGCAATPPAAGQTPGQIINEVDRAIRSLNGDIDPDEARRAARIAVEYSRQLAQEYEVSGSPLFHNLLVNLGIKERGLCVHWTRDLMVRLQQERFRTIDLHWAIANYESAFRIEHSTVVLSARDAGLQQGLILDPWRYSGQLFFAPLAEDPQYQWRPQAEILALKKKNASDKAEPGFVR